MSSAALWLLLLCAPLLVTGAKGPEHLPYDAWRLGFSAPSYMDVWIETAHVLDREGRLFLHAGSGLPSIHSPPSLKADPRGWPANPGWGAGKYVRGAALPHWIYVRWQSLGEPQTYEVSILIDEATRRAMVKPEKALCSLGPKWITDHRHGVDIGLAPGGIVQVWISGPCLKSIPVTRLQATVVKRGPYEGLSGGHYYHIDDASKAYIEKYGIPYGSW